MTEDHTPHKKRPRLILTDFFSAPAPEAVKAVNEDSAAASENGAEQPPEPGIPTPDDELHGRYR